MRWTGECAQPPGRLNAVHAGHGDIHQRHVRMMSGGFVNRLASVGAGENNIEPACGIVFEDQPHGLADHRIVIDHANCYRSVVAVLVAAHWTHARARLRWDWR